MTDALHRTNRFYWVYQELLESLLEEGVTQHNHRTGHDVFVLPGGASFKLNLRDGVLPVPASRKVWPGTAAAEVAWFVTGSKDIAFLQHRRHKMWDKFVEPGTTTVLGAYGHRMRSAFGRDQLLKAVYALRQDATDRRVYVSIWDPREDGLGAAGQRSVPCPVGFTLSVVDGRLHSSLLIRSSDVFVGLPYDVMGHSILMSILAASVGVRLGSLHVTLGHAHLYDEHLDMARTCVRTNLGTFPELAMPTYWSLEQVDLDPHKFADDYMSRAKACAWPEFNPIPEIVA